MRSDLLLGALVLAMGTGGALAQWDFFNGVVYGMASSLGMSPGVTNDALLMGRAASCELTGVGCVGQVVIDPLSVESRLELECVDATAEDVAQDHGRCYDKLWDGAVYGNLFSRARASGSPYLASKGDYRWVSEIAWSGPQAAYQSYEGLQLDAAWGFWKTRDYPLWDCGAGSSKGCRRASLCRMTERGFGRVLANQGARLINLQDTDDVVFKFPDGRSAGFGSRVTGSCMACLTVPCEPYWCMNGRVPGYALKSEPLFMNKVMERWPCERSCGAGTFLTCSQGSACWYKPATDHELGGGAAGLREWYGYNAFTNKTGANLVQWEKRGPPVEECYPCVEAYRRMHFGVFADTERGLFNRGFLEFTCPGGAQGPVDCPANMVSRVDAATGRSGACGCRPGFYWGQDQGACRPCPAGHFCAWDGVTPPGAPVECPNDTYSTGGAEACSRCSTSRQCDAGQALRRCLQNGAAGESGKFQTGDSECVPCFQCSQLGSGEDQVPCFKVSSLKAV